MKKLNNGIKILLAVMVMAIFIGVGYAEGADTAEYEITTNDSIFIRGLSSDGSEVMIANESWFDLSVDWNYVYCNSDGMIEFGVMREGDDEIIEKYAYSDFEYFMATPVSNTTSGENNIDYDTIKDQLIEIIKIEGATATRTMEVDFRYEYTIDNTSPDMIQFISDNECMVDYVMYDSDDIEFDSAQNIDIQELRLASGDKLVFTVNDRIAYSIDDPIVAEIKYNTGRDGSVVANCEILAEYSWQNVILDMEGLKHTIKNKSREAIMVSSQSPEHLRCIVYNSDGTVKSDSSNCYVIPEIPAGGWVVVYVENETEATGELSVGYDVSYKDYLEFTAVRKAMAQETKKIYIHFPEGSLVPSGLSKDSTGYYISATVTYVETPTTADPDFTGGFSIPKITDTTGMATVNKWYVYNSKTNTYNESTSVIGETLEVVPVETDFYKALDSVYSYGAEYHLYVEWKTSTIEKSGTYNLVQGVEYYLGSGTWTIGDDPNVYPGNKKFYVDESRTYKFSVR